MADWREYAATNDERTLGDCFRVAAELVLANPGFTLVHALVTAPDDSPGTDGTAQPGERHAHAWAETEHPVTFPDGRTRRTVVCVEISNGRSVALLRGDYYDGGKIRQTVRYTSAAARALIVETGTWGPWRDLP